MRFIIVKIKRIAIAALAAVTMATSVISIPVSASTVDTDFEIVIPNSGSNYNQNSRRKKATSTSTYVNYSKTVGPNYNGKATGPNKIKMYVYGSNGSSGTLANYTCGTSVIVTKGTKGYIKQTVYETFGSNSYAQLKGAKASGYTTGIARGCWSPDSASESGAINYN
jgi:hypothetical protein